jgi:hypothetical protein
MAIVCSLRFCNGPFPNLDEAQPLCSSIQKLYFELILQLRKAAANLGSRYPTHRGALKAVGCYDVNKYDKRAQIGYAFLDYPRNGIIISILSHYRK